MELGLILMNGRSGAQDVAFAERHGFATAGFVDSQLLTGEVFACVALAALATERIRVGPMLAIPHNRSSLVAAQGAATINALAPGRTFFATGTGYTARSMLGLGPVPAAAMRDYALEVRALLDGQEIIVDTAQGPRPVRLAPQPEATLDLDSHIPVYVAGAGPKALRAAGESGDGWITTMQYDEMMSPSAIGGFTRAFAAVRAAGQAAGRQVDDWYTMISTTACVLRPGETPTDDRVLARVGPVAVLALHSAALLPDIVDLWPPAWRDTYALYERRVLAHMDRSRLHVEVHRGHLAHLLDGEAEVLAHSEDLIRATSLTGTADELREQLRGLDGAGMRNLTLTFPDAGMREGIAEIAELVATL
jgi:5,10-methylenetetrahydromethanopterin reductase